MNTTKVPWKKTNLLGQNLVLTILMVVGLTVAHMYPLNAYGENIFPGVHLLIIAMVSFVTTGVIHVLSSDDDQDIRYRLIAYCSHLIVIMCLYAVLGGTWRGAGLLAALFLVVGLLLLVPFPKDHGDPLTDRGLRTALLSLLFGTAGYGAVMATTSIW